MEDPQQEPEEKKNLSELMFGLTQFTQSIQHEIATVLIQKPEIRTRIEKLINKPDHEIVESLNKSVREFIIAMAVAENYGVNIMMNVIAAHSSVTGDNALSEAMAVVREKIQQLNN